MVAKAESLPLEWGEDLNIRWRAEVEGDSWTSPIVWGKKVFLASSVPVKVAAAPERREGTPLDGEDESLIKKQGNKLRKVDPPVFPDMPLLAFPVGIAHSQGVELLPVFCYIFIKKIGLPNPNPV